MDEKLTKFLTLVPNANWRGNTPQTWSIQLRQSLSDGLVAVGFGGVLMLTDAGRGAAKLGYRIEGSQQWQS
jgi:hypothetical protein